MNASEDGSSARAIEKRFNSLKWTSGCRGRRIASVNLIWPLLIFSFGPTLW
jgi:hypothetical protein